MIHSFCYTDARTILIASNSLSISRIKLLKLLSCIAIIITLNDLFVMHSWILEEIAVVGGKGPGNKPCDEKKIILDEWFSPIHIKS